MTRCGRPVQRISFRFQARGFLQYQVRMMTGALVLVAKGELGVDQIQTLLDNPDADNDQIPRSTAPGLGLTMVDAVYKEGMLFKEPHDIPEDYFMRGYKRRLEKIGITYEVPDADKDQDFGDLFD